MSFLFLFFFSVVAAQLRLQHFQTTGTHNSYHIPSNPTTIHWNYSHPALSVQLSFQKVRVLELDVTYNSTTGIFDVFHIPIYDSNANCKSLNQCATNLRDWSLANSYHGPIFVQIEPKNPGAFTTAVWNSYDAVRRDQVLNVGWPYFSDSLGKIIFFTTGGYAGYNSGINAGLVNRTSFIAYDLNNFNRTDCAMLIVDDPVTYSSNISAMVQRNLIIRTRADANYFPGAEFLSQPEISSQYFDVADTNNNQILSVSEIQLFSSALDTPLTNATINFLQSLCGGNSSGFIFSQWNCAILTLEQLGYQVIPKTPTLAQTIIERDTAYASGAHLVSTDYPIQGKLTLVTSDRTGLDSYWAETPGGFIYRCNPITTRNLNCSSSDFEKTPSVTSGRITTSFLTTSPYLTSSPVTSGSLTSSPMTTSVLTSGSLTSSSVTTSPLTTSPMTSSALTSGVITTSGVLSTSSLASGEQLTSGMPMTTNENSITTSIAATSSKLTSIQMTSSEITTSSHEHQSEESSSSFHLISGVLILVSILM